MKCWKKEKTEGEKRGPGPPSKMGWWVMERSWETIPYNFFPFPYGLVGIPTDVQCVKCFTHDKKMPSSLQWTWPMRSLIWIPLTDFPLPHYFIHQNHRGGRSDRILCVLAFNLRNALQLGVGRGVKGHQQGAWLKKISSLSIVSSACYNVWLR